MVSTQAPRPLVPLAPILSAASFRRAAPVRLPSLLDAGPARLVTSGRIAIALALREMGVGPGHEVLVPAWHSPSMLPPVLWRGAVPVFYRLRADATIDLEDLAARIGPATRAVMLTHYFGFMQPVEQVRALCDAHGLQLLEDCAHAFIGRYRGRPVGAVGDYAIGSSMKFFPIHEGGALVSGRHALDRVKLHGAGAGFEAKSALDALEKGFAYGRLPAARAALWLPLRLKGALWKLVKRRGAAPALAPSSSDSSFDFDPAWLDKRSSLFSRAMLRLMSPSRIAALRRANYLRLDAALRGLPGIRPLFPALPDGVCPWVYPLLADDPERLFARIDAAGVPVTRFGLPLPGSAADGACANSAWLARHVLSFPCHQELREAELDWIVGQIAKALQA
ncbi:aminotransferase class I/II-fold pyridoxal phosphate-dependent enzyme [Massilia aerilata]|uniref:Aminotransferase class I/II-fold pyridoxal phosphate-dependent enzyme n=1 Tax=Massilia aerilata TaxID=453817 RepID=A0ABW0S5J7_9BURK